MSGTRLVRAYTAWSAGTTTALTSRELARGSLVLVVPMATGLGNLAGRGIAAGAVAAQQLQQTLREPGLGREERKGERP